MRRIALPKRLAGTSGIEPDDFVALSRAGGDGPAIVVRKVGYERSTGRLRDPGRARRVTSTWQVTLPGELMDEVGLAIRDWVYVARGDDGASLRLFHAADVGFIREGGQG